MSNRIKSYCLILFYFTSVFLAGCFPEPENSLDWSDNGSVGLLRIEGALYLVDGQTNELIEIAKEGVMPWPDISEDGSVIAYSQEVDCYDLAKGLELLPPGQAKMIEYNAKKCERIF